TSSSQAIGPESLYGSVQVLQVVKGKAGIKDFAEFLKSTPKADRIKVPGFGKTAFATTYQGVESCPDSLNFHIFAKNGKGFVVIYAHLEGIVMNGQCARNGVATDQMGDAAQVALSNL